MNVSRVILTTRTHALAVQCPKCNAAADEPCIGARGKLRTACHAERHELAVNLGAPVFPSLKGQVNLAR